MEKRQKKLVAYLVKKYQKTFLTKIEAKKELMYDIEKQRISMDDAAKLICDEYRSGMVF